MERLDNLAAADVSAVDDAERPDGSGSLPESQTQVGVDELEPEMGGRWEVHTRTSTHIWDMDAMTYTRLPGEDATPMEYDGQAMPITRVGRWPVVGGQSLVFFDDPVDQLMEQWRICARIRRILAPTN